MVPEAQPWGLLRLRRAYNNDNNTNNNDDNNDNKNENVKADFCTSQCDLCRVRMSHNRPLYTYSSMGNAYVPDIARPTLGRALDGSADQRAAESNSTYCQKERII